MKSLFGQSLLCAVLAGFLSACTSVYTDSATEKEFHKISSAFCARNDVFVATAEYQVSGFDYTDLQITAKRDGKLNLRYSGGKRTPVELRMNGAAGAVFNGKNNSSDPFAGGDAAVLSLAAFQTLFWYGPESIAERIEPGSTAPEKLDGTGPLCRQFLLTPKKDFAPYVKNVRLFADAETYAVRRISYDLIAGKTACPVCADFMASAWYPEKDLFPAKVRISCRNSKLDFVLRSSGRNKPVSDELFRLSASDRKTMKKSDNLK